MAPVKFEEQIKDKLKNRKIKPSGEAWDKIVNNLDASQHTKKKSFFWYGIAAGFVGLMIISLWYFKPVEAEIIKDIEVVDVPKKEVDEEHLNLDIVLDKKNKNKNMTPNGEQAIPVKDVLADQQTIKNKQNGNAVVQVKETPDKVKTDLWDGSKEIIDIKIAEVIAQVDQLEQDNAIVTNAEIDSLLRVAQKEILTDKLVKGNKKVDPAVLLAEAEFELDKSFRDQIFETLKNGYLKVRTAVADRNN